MPDIDDVAARNVTPLAAAVTSDTTRVVADAFLLVIAPEDEYVESDVLIESLEFASYVVGGLAASITTPNAGVRAETQVSLPLSDSSGGQAVSSQPIILFGPGDVNGIDPQQILRRYPAPGTPNAEESALAHIEFDRPELPWVFSAAAPADGLRPWVTLVVLERATVRWLPATAMLPLVEVPVDELPRLTGAHFWAHAQTAQSGAVPLEVRLSQEYARVNLSRLMSGRVLKEETDYLAAVVPTTDVGARAGRGLTGGTLSVAWASGIGNTVVLPVYDSWEFRTGEDGDFQTLAMRLKGVPAPYEVGRRVIDVSEPGLPLSPLPEGEPGAKQVLRCALYSPTPPPPGREEGETAAWPLSKTTELRAQLDLPAALEGSEPADDGIPDVPILGPRIYGKLHRGAAVISGSDWFAELNLSPMHRIVAGLGTRVVQTEQEQLMQAAWAQLGDVQRANRAIVLAELAEFLATRLHTRLTELEPSRLLQVAGPLASRISLSDGRTLSAEIGASATPAIALTGAFRRSIRPGGPLLRRMDAAVRGRSGMLVGVGLSTRDFTRLYANPDGVSGLSSESIADLEPTLVARVLEVTTGSVPDVLRRADASVETGIFAHLADTSAWRATDRGFDLGAAVAARWGEAVLRPATIPAIAGIRNVRIAPLVAELATARATKGLPVARELREHAKTLNNSMVIRHRDLSEAVDPGRAPVRRGRARGAAGFVARGAAIGALDVPITLARVTTSTSAENTAMAFTRLASLAAIPVSPVLDAIEVLPVEAFRAAIPALLDPAGVAAIAPVTRRDTVQLTALAAVLDPRVTVRQALKGRLRLSPDLAGRVFLPDRIRRIMAAPIFRRPMYEALHAYDRDWLIPGLGMLPDTDFVTVLATNSQFMEAFLVGLCDEMGRELLWRNYPTDQSGTYFRRFWDKSEDELDQQIHAFSRTALGTHVSTGGSGGTGPRAVIVVKSDLIRRYPDAIIQVVQNHGSRDDPQFDGPDAVIATQLFAAHLPPDVALVGVDLSPTQLNGDEWWITIAEHPTATRFDRSNGADTSTLKFYPSTSFSSAADVATDRLHEPVRVAFHATDLVV